ncbi:VanZ family protein [Psychroserpens sp. XS_ASV72]|uniref:VanZ family protein n=1 Tax=Psychroserpens sp. XS_ASV72 TaxID=3241293 RepID=UPI0035178F51
MLKRWALPILLTYVVALTIGSLSQVSSVPDLGSSFDDKIYHFLAYAILTFLIFNFLRSTSLKAPLFSAALVSVVYGIIIEVLQSVLTDFRTPDYLDVIANTIGTVIMYISVLFAGKGKLK